MIDLKRIIKIFIIICLVIVFIFVICSFFIKDKKKGIVEYTPQEEISDAQMRQTMISLYFKSGENLVPEPRLIDVKQLLSNPYEEIINMLIEGPKNTSLERTIPEGTKLNKIRKENDNLIIDFSIEFVENHRGAEIEEKLTINSIVNTLTELTEINGVKILINGEENRSFKDEKVKFDKIFERSANGNVSH